MFIYIDYQKQINNKNKLFRIYLRNLILNKAQAKNRSHLPVVIQTSVTECRIQLRWAGQCQTIRMTSSDLYHARRCFTGACMWEHQSWQVRAIMVSFKKMDGMPQTKTDNMQSLSVLVYIQYKGLRTAPYTETISLLSLTLKLLLYATRTMKVRKEGYGRKN